MRLQGLLVGAARFSCAVVLTLTAVAVLTSSAGADIIQDSNTSGTVGVAGSTGFVAQLGAASGFNGSVTFTASPTQSTPQGIVVNSAGTGIMTTGTLAVGSYVIGGTDSDTASDTGTWSYTLNVTPILQGPSVSNSVTVANSAGFVDSLSAASGFTGSVTFTASPTQSTPQGIVVNSAGTGIMTTGPLAVGSYVIGGTDTDTASDTGTWSYTLNVTPNTIVQGSPMSNSVSVARSADFSDALSAASGSIGPVTFTSSGATEGLEVNGDQISTTGSLGVGQHTISGTDQDGFGDTGTWTYTLNVELGGGSTLTQTSALFATTSTQALATFVPGAIKVANGVGVVTFVTTQSSPHLSVSAVGTIELTGAIIPGTYAVSGTDSDTKGDTGTWTYALTVTGVVTTVTFDANAGVGAMTPESDSAPTRLTLNDFKRPGYSFVDWNTLANGSGVSYANGSVYPFGISATLFAQWKAGKAPSRTITFEANGGTGSTPSEVDNTPTAISANGFVRSGFTFNSWNTHANGTGVGFNAGATYPFKVSVTLYAQWKKLLAAPARVVTFGANGGVGAMTAERHRKPTKLAPDRYTRAGFTFVGWNTSANGSGVSYVNGAIFPFATSATLYAQWKKNKKVVSAPPNPNEVSVGPFGSGASTLSSAIEGQIQSLAEKVMANKDTQITLLGYGDVLTPVQLRNKDLRAANVLLGRMRAQAVAADLQERLEALGLTGWTMSLGVGASGTFGSSQSAMAVVVATVS